MRRTRAILTDIEGTTTRIAFVRDMLFSYARQHLPAFLAQSGDRPEVAAALAEIAAIAPGQTALAALLGWMDVDAKVTPLKTLQGLVWRDGYARGVLRGDVYDDVPPALRQWRAAGISVQVYSSGSVEAQRLLFAHSVAGDLSGLFDGFHDTARGAKRDPMSYRSIATAAGIAAPDWLFLSDTEAELDAASVAGMATCQVVRAEDGTVASARHVLAAEFGAVDPVMRAA
jgi:enolase-phosphatase E1